MNCKPLLLLALICFGVASPLRLAHLYQVSAAWHCWASDAAGNWQLCFLSWQVWFIALLGSSIGNTRLNTSWRWVMTRLQLVLFTSDFFSPNFQRTFPCMLEHTEEEENLLHGFQIVQEVNCLFCSFCMFTSSASLRNIYIYLKKDSHGFLTEDRNKESCS